MVVISVVLDPTVVEVSIDDGELTSGVYVAVENNNKLAGVDETITIIVNTAIIVKPLDTCMHLQYEENMCVPSGIILRLLLINIGCEEFLLSPMQLTALTVTV